MTLKGPQMQLTLMASKYKGHADGVKSVSYTHLTLPTKA